MAKQVSDKQDINQATKEDLVKLPQMSDARAETIVHYREQHGPFESIEDISKVPGIGNIMAEQVAEFFEVGEESSETTRGKGSKTSGSGRGGSRQSSETRDEDAEEDGDLEAEGEAEDEGAEQEDSGSSSKKSSSKSRK